MEGLDGADAQSGVDVLGDAPAGRRLGRQGDPHHRIVLLRAYLTQLQRATAEGVPVRGYSVSGACEIERCSGCIASTAPLGIVHRELDCAVVAGLPGALRDTDFSGLENSPAFE